MVINKKKNFKNLKHHQYPKYRAKTSNSKSLSVRKYDNQNNHKNKTPNNEYGLQEQGRTFQMLKSLGIKNNLITPIRDKSNELSKEQIEQYLELLTDYVQTGKDQKIISTLQILLNHYIKKVAKARHEKRRSIDSIYSTASKAQIIPNIQSPLFNESQFL